MNSKVIFDKLPIYYRTNNLFQKIVEQIAPSKVMFSYLFYQKNGKDYGLKKDGTMYAPLDWQAFSIMRAFSKLIVVTGKTVRIEKGLYLTREAFGDKNIQDLYSALQGQKTQKLMVVTNSMTRPQLQQQVNPQFYELMYSSNINSFTHLLQDLVETEEGPILVELGLIAMQKYFKQVLQGGPNTIDTIMLTRFAGPLPKQYIGDETVLPIETLYKKTWESQSYPCILPGNIDGNLTFSIHTL